jgi:hypothetical protein
MTAGSRVAGVLAVAGLLVTGCGGDASTLERADDAMAELERGDVTVGVVARAGGPEGSTTTSGPGAVGPVGFTMKGRFDAGAGTDLPVLDLTYTRLLGGNEEVVTVQSDGRRMVVTSGGVPVEVPPDQARRLQLGGGDRPAGLGELGIGGWITEPTESDGPTVDGVATRRVAGPVDAADLISDLALLADQVSGQERSQPLDDEAKKRVQSRVRSGDVEVLVDSDDLPRRVRATVDFGATVSPELQRALGAYAGAGMEVTLEIRAPGRPVTPPSLR